MKKGLKRLFIGLGGLLLFLLIAAIAIPYFFKDEITAQVKQGINDNVNAKVDFSDVSLSLLRSFPSFSLRLNDLTVDGVDEFSGVRLADIKGLDFSMDLWSVITGKQPYTIKSITLNEPVLNVQVLKNGKANYDIAKPSETETKTTTSSSDGFELKLNQYKINDGQITYADRSSDIFMNIKNLDHKGSGNFTASIYDIATRTYADAVTVEMGGVPYLNKAKADLDITVNADMKKNRFTLKDNTIKLNALQLDADGFVEMPNDKDIVTDIKFSAPSTEFKQLLSIIPAAFTGDFGSVDAKGKMAFNGFAKGTYNENNLPAFAINLDVIDGYFKYPDLPLGVNDIQTNIKLNSPSSDYDRMTLDVPLFKMLLDKNPFEAKLKLRTPVSDPDVDTEIKGKIDLADLAKAFPMEGVEAITGLINADVKIKSKMSYIDKQQYEKVGMAGEFSATKLKYDAADMPTVLINQMAMQFSPKNVNIPEFNAKLGKSDLKASGSIDNILAYFSTTENMAGNLTLRSNFLDANEWLAEGRETESTSSETGSEQAGGGVFDRFDFRLDANLKKVEYENYVLKNVNTKGRFQSNKFEIEDLSCQIDKSDLALSGTFNDVFSYLFDYGTISGNATVKSKFFDTNAFLESNEGEAEATTSENETYGNSNADYFGKFDVDLDGQFGQLNYDIYKLKNVNVDGQLTQDKMSFRNFSASLGKSDFKTSGNFENALGYVYRNETIRGNLNLNSNYMDYEDVMGPAEPAGNSKVATTEEAWEVIPVPDKMDFNIKSNINKLKYDGLNINNFNGQLLVKNEKVEMKNVKMETLGGRIATNGSYDTKDIKKPVYAFDSKFQRMDIRQTFDYFNSFKAFAPIVDFIEGRMNFDFAMNGNLKEDMMPDLTKISVDGFLETLDAMVKNFKPVNDLGNQLKVSELKNLKISDTKNWFEIKEGRFILKPVDHIFNNDITANISGSHGITQDMDYMIKTKVPRKLLEGNNIGKMANNGLAVLGDQASKLGINLVQGENINLNINVLGNIKKPKFKIKLLGTEGKSVKEEIVDKGKEVLDEGKEVAKEVVDDAKDKAKQAGQEAVDKSKEIVKTTVDDIKDKGKDAIKGGIDDIKKSGKDAVKDAGKDVVTGAKDAGKDILKGGKEDIKEKANDVKDKFKGIFNKKKKKKGGR